MNQAKYKSNSHWCGQRLSAKSKVLSVVGKCLIPRDGLAGLNKALQSLKKPWIVCEATGGYEQRLLQFAHKKALPVTLVNPARVRAFAKSEGLKAKSDPMDAALLLRFAKSKDLKPTPPPSPQQQTLQALMDRRSQLTESLAREEKQAAEISAVCAHIYWEDDRHHWRRNWLKSTTRLNNSLPKIHWWMSKAQQCNRSAASARPPHGLSSHTSVKSTPWNAINLLHWQALLPLTKTAVNIEENGVLKAVGPRSESALYHGCSVCCCSPISISRHTSRVLRNRGKPYKCAIVAAMRKLLIHIQSILKNTQFSLAC